MQEILRITGSPTPSLEGTIKVVGAKNAILKAMAAAILYRTPLTLTNVPAILDVEALCGILESLGATTSRGDHTLVLDASGMTGSSIPASMMSTLRASIVMAGPLLARFGQVIFSHPGGDIIGERPIDLFLETFVAMGAEVVKDDGSYGVRVPGGRLKGAEIFFRIQSVTGTETAMLAAILAEGTTIIKNAALEPEIVWLAEMLNASGANITGAGTTTITIVGSTELLRAPKRFATVPDRIEAGSFLILGCLAAKDLLIEDCVPEHLEAVVHLLCQAGANIEVGAGSLRVKAAPLKPMHIKTHEYPGYPTDLMAPMVTLLTQVPGESRVFETIWDNRLAFVEVLRVMGANITTMDPHRVLIKGPRPLKARNMESPDIRAGLAFLIAAAVADGTSEISNIHHIDRGYENIAERLQNVGMQIERVAI